MKFRSMKIQIWPLLLAFVLCFAPVAYTRAETPAQAQEDWKGQPDNHDVSFGALTGLGIRDREEGFTLLGTLGFKVVRQGFVPDVNNSVTAELQFGPARAYGRTFANYSAHLRWDFQKDPNLIVYALGGLAGYSGHGEFTIFPRVGLGLMYDMAKTFLWRFELSHEVIAVGVVFPLWF
jgi:hypothetical protein